MLLGVEYVRDFCRTHKIPISGLEKECRFSNGYLNPQKLSKIPYDRALEIKNFMDIRGFKIELNRILGVEPKTNPEHNVEQTLTQKDERDISRRLEQALEDLEGQQEGLMFDGEPLDEETKELLKISLENSIRIAKLNAKQKFTPKKYRKTGDN